MAVSRIRRGMSAVRHGPELIKIQAQGQDTAEKTGPVPWLSKGRAGKTREVQAAIFSRFLVCSRVVIAAATMAETSAMLAGRIRVLVSLASLPN